MRISTSHAKQRKVGQTRTKAVATKTEATETIVKSTSSAPKLLMKNTKSASTNTELFMTNIKFRKSSLENMPSKQKLEKNTSCDGRLLDYHSSRTSGSNNVLKDSKTYRATMVNRRVKCKATSTEKLQKNTTCKESLSGKLTGEKSKKVKLGHKRSIGSETSSKESLEKERTSKKQSAGMARKSLVLKSCQSPETTIHRTTVSTSSLSPAKRVEGSSFPYRQSSWNFTQNLLENLNQSEEQNANETIEKSRSDESTSDYFSCLGSFIPQILQESKSSMARSKTNRKEDGTQDNSRETIEKSKSAESTSDYVGCLGSLIEQIVQESKLSIDMSRKRDEAPHSKSEIIEKSRSDETTSDYVSCLGSLIAQILQESKISMANSKINTKEDGTQGNSRETIEISRSDESTSDSVSCLGSFIPQILQESKLSIDRSRKRDSKSEITEKSRSDESTSDYFSCLGSVIEQILQESKFSMARSKTRLWENEDHDNSNEIIEKPRSEESTSDYVSSLGSLIEKILRESKFLIDSSKTNTKEDKLRDTKSEIIEISRSNNSTSDYVICLGSLIAQILEESKFSVESGETNTREDETWDNTTKEVDNKTESDELSVYEMDSLSEIPVLARSSILSDIISDVIKKTSTELVAEVKKADIPGEEICDGNLTEEAAKKIVTTVVRQVLSDVSAELGEPSQTTQAHCPMSDTELLNRPIVETCRKITNSQSESTGFKVETIDTVTNGYAKIAKPKEIRKRISKALENIVTKLAKKNLMEACSGWIKRNVSCCCRSRWGRPCGPREPVMERDSIASTAQLHSSSSSSSRITIQEKHTPFSRLTPSNDTLFINSSCSELSIDNYLNELPFRKRNDRKIFGDNDTLFNGISSECLALDTESNSLSPKSSSHSSHMSSCKTPSSDETDVL